tara:strand:+ start:2175 stop:2750 length:576 start_codon:yes stop_codon:yes gene_type:complete
VSTWQSFVYVAFVIDTFADRILGWRMSRFARTDFVLPSRQIALQSPAGQWMLLNRPCMIGGLCRKGIDPSLGSPHSCIKTCTAGQSDGQYLSTRYTERLVEAGIEPSVGNVGDSYDNTLAETIIGLYKTELVHRQDPWRNMQGLEMAALGWVVWFNKRRLLGPYGNIPRQSLNRTSMRTTTCSRWLHEMKL